VQARCLPVRPGGEPEPVFVLRGYRPGRAAQAGLPARVGDPGGPGVIGGTAHTIVAHQDIPLMRNAAGDPPGEDDPGRPGADRAEKTVISPVSDPAGGRTAVRVDSVSGPGRGELVTNARRTRWRPAAASDRLIGHVSGTAGLCRWWWLCLRCLGSAGGWLTPVTRLVTCALPR
jgi:hypothetical protein